MNKFKKTLLPMFLISLVFGISACSLPTKQDDDTKSKIIDKQENEDSTTAGDKEKEDKEDINKVGEKQGIKTESTTTEEVAEIITSDIDTSDWKTYRNEEYGFEFKYPENWMGAPDGWKNALTVKITKDKELRDEQLIFKNSIQNSIILGNQINGHLDIYYTTVKKDENSRVLNNLFYGVNFFLNNDLIEIAIILPRSRNYNLPSEIEDLNLFIQEIKIGKSEYKINNMLDNFKEILNTFIFLK